MKEKKNKELFQSYQETTTGNEHQLILINDDIHTFDYVIDALIEVCDHSAQQATQCTMIVHYKGSCGIKKGSYEELRPMRKALWEKELKATIE